jgi:hypothetical protein
MDPAFVRNDLMHSMFQTANRVLIGALAAMLLVAGAGGQSPAGQGPSEANHFIETPAGWVPPKTAWGDPDLQGMWPISYVGSVPLERCASFFGGRGRGASTPCDPNKAFLTEEEYQARLAAAAKQGDRHAEAIAEGNFGRALQSGIVDPTFPQRQTSLIVDPPNGRLPEMTEEGKRLSALMKSSWGLPGETQVWDSWLDFDTWDRCITRGMPASMFPFRYNNGLQIIQVPGYVIFNMEMIHEVRMIPVDGRPKLSPAIKQWLGESRGRWEGNTLIIETTNFMAGASATNIGVAGSPPGNRFPTSEQMKITERMTRLNDAMLLYEITTEDPVVLTRPWTARFPLKLQPDYEWWEYGCHEGNRTIPDYISTSRAERARQAESAAQPPATPPAAPADRSGRGGR